MSDNGLSRGKIAFLSCLLLAGVGLLAWAGYRAYRPPVDLKKGAEEDLERRGFKPLSGELEKLVNDPSFRPMPTQVHPLLNKDAPAFALLDTNRKEWNLDGKPARPVVLVFYYGYNCDHCVSQLFALSKDLPKFEEVGAEVVAVSGDDPALTRKRYATYGAFAFPVLSDPGNKVAELYGAYRPGRDGKAGEQAHATLIIGRDGKVVWANWGDVPFTDNRTLLVELARMRLPTGG